MLDPRRSETTVVTLGIGVVLAINQTPPLLSRLLSRELEVGIEAARSCGRRLEAQACVYRQLSRSNPSPQPVHRV